MTEIEQRFLAVLAMADVTWAYLPDRTTLIFEGHRFRNYGTYFEIIAPAIGVTIDSHGLHARIHACPDTMVLFAAIASERDEQVFRAIETAFDAYTVEHPEHRHHFDRAAGAWS